MYIPFPVFTVKGVDPPEDIKEYECEFYAVNAHKYSCFFCDHCTDIWWDFSNGPYMILCTEDKCDSLSHICRYGCEYCTSNENRLPCSVEVI